MSQHQLEHFNPPSHSSQLVVQLSDQIQPLFQTQTTKTQKQKAMGIKILNGDSKRGHHPLVTIASQQSPTIFFLISI